MKRKVLIFVCAMIMGLLSGCGQQINASSYLKAYLDNCYKRNADSLVEMSVMTENEAMQIRQSVLDEELKTFASAFGVTSQQLAGLSDNLSDVQLRTKYSVGDAVEQADGSFVVTVTYEQLNVYAPTVEAYNGQSNMLTTSWDALGETLTSEQQSGDIVIMLEYVMGVTLLNATYDTPQTMDVRVGFTDGVYKANEDDLKKLDYVLFDNQDAHF